MTSRTTGWFVFTDIVDSTRLWDTWPAEMAIALERHDRALDDVVTRTSGTPVKHTGDGMLLRFERADDAVEAAIGIQLALDGLEVIAEEPLRVRIGIDGGEVWARDGDFYGPVMNRLARVMGAGHGGQVLASDEIVAERRGDPAWAFRSLGSYRFKGLIEPTTVHQVEHPGLPASFEPLRALNAETGNLRRATVDLVGRDDLVDRVVTALETPGVVTLLGPGGVGKTTLATVAAQATMHLAPDGLWFVDLASLGSDGLVAELVAATMNIDRRPDRTIVQTLTEALASRQLVLVLDNCEHVVAGARSVVGELSEAAPSVRIIATSRRALNVAGERRLPIGPLDTPRPGSTPAEVARSGAVQLFLERARERGTTIQVTDDNADDLGHLCRELDGIPLAIELAAARTDVLTLADIVSGLDERLLLLADRSAEIARHRTMEETIAWSHRLLDDMTKARFRNLTIFEGGFDLAAFAAVVGAPRHQAVDTISELVDLHLVMVQDLPTGRRYRLLGTVRDFTTTLPPGNDHDEATERHADHYRELLATALPKLNTDDEQTWLDLLRIELGNLRLLFEHDLQHRIGDAAQMALDLWPLWAGRNSIEEGFRWLERARDVLPDDHPILPRVFDDLASVAWTRGDDVYAEKACAASIAAAERLGQPVPITTLIRLASVRALQNRPDEAMELINEAADRLDDHSPTSGPAALPSVIGVTLALAGDVDRGVALCERGIEEARHLGPGRRASALSNGAFCFLLHDPHRALAAAQEALVQAEIVGSDGSLGYAHFALALCNHRLRERHQSLGHAASALRHMQSTGSFQEAPACLETIAAQSIHDLDAATCLIAAADGIRQRVGRPGIEREQRSRSRWVTRLRDELGDDRFDAQWQLGEMLDFDRAIEAGIALCDLELAADGFDAWVTTNGAVRTPALR